MKKNHLVILTVVTIFVIGGAICSIFLLKAKLQSQGGVFRTGAEEIFSLSGIIASVDSENKFLMVKSTSGAVLLGQDFKVMISESTKLIKLEATFDPKNPPKPGTQFTPKQTEITIGDFKEGDDVFIKSSDNIAQKTEISNVEFVQVQP